MVYSHMAGDVMPGYGWYHAIVAPTGGFGPYHVPQNNSVVQFGGNYVPEFSGSNSAIGFVSPPGVHFGEVGGRVMYGALPASTMQSQVPQLVTGWGQQVEALPFSVRDILILFRF